MKKIQHKRRKSLVDLFTIFDVINTLCVILVDYRRLNFKILLKYFHPRDPDDKSVQKQDSINPDLSFSSASYRVGRDIKLSTLVIKNVDQFCQD